MSKSKLYISGLQEPILITQEEAEIIQRLKSDDSKPPATPIVIENVWSGAKKDVRYIKFPDKESSYAERKQIEAMSDADAALYERKILPFKCEAEMSGFGTYTWKLFYMQNAGAIRIDLHHDKKGKPHLIEVVTDPFLYPKIQDEISSYYMWQGRKQYAEQQEIKRLEEVANTL